LQIGFVLGVGYLYDIMGRRFTVFATLIPGAILIMFIPNVAPSINLLILLRIGIVMSLSTLGSHPFVNDYVNKDTRGRAIAL
jgi:MFS family permease